MKTENKFKSKKGFSENILDFLYDNIDYIFMVIVIIAVALIINWRIRGLFDTATSDKENLISNNPSNYSEEKSKAQRDLDAKNNPSKKTNKDSELSDVLIEISIPAGSPSQVVAEILGENNLVDDAEEFYNYVAEQGMETKLKYGNYSIPENADYDKIIEILTK